MAVKHETHLSTRPNRKNILTAKYWVLYSENTWNKQLLARQLLADNIASLLFSLTFLFWTGLTSQTLKATDKSVVL